MNDAAISAPTYTAFAATKCVARGPLPAVLPVLKTHHDRDASELVLVFDDETGRQVDFDLRGTLDDVLERAGAANAPSGPGRPKLGVVSREVSLLPRHWEWLEGQPQGISAALRRLVEHARKNEPGAQQGRRMRAALSNVLTAVAGDRPHFEEATRALFARDQARFESLVRRWPVDIKAYALRVSREAVRLERSS